MAYHSLGGTRVLNTWTGPDGRTIYRLSLNQVWILAYATGQYTPSLPQPGAQERRSGGVPYAPPTA